MGRSSETRARVRALAVVWTAEGRELSPKAVLAALGEGSLTTIVDELRRFREERLEQEQSDPGRAAALSAMTGPDAQLVPAKPPKEESAPSDPEAVATPSELEQVTAALEKAIARFDAMQRRMLREIDEARETARYWKDEAERAKQQARTEIDGYRTGMQKEAERANILQGRLDQLLSTREMHQSGA